MIFSSLPTAHNSLRPKSGFLIVQILVFASVSVIVLGALAFWGVTSFTATRKATMREQAFHIAEAGIEYYRWHLAHNATDYKDGTNSAGPYVHNYYDKTGNQIGQFTLTITPPSSGGATVLIRSKGNVTADPTISRTVEATLAIPSYARYAVLGGEAILSFGEDVDVTGLVLGNNGVRFNGTAHNIVSSAVDKFDDTTVSPKVTDRLGVYTDRAPSDPAAPVDAIPQHSDVFLAGREFPPFNNVIAVDFSALTSTLSDLRDLASLPEGFHLGKAGGSSPGYHIVLKTDGTFDLYTVTKLVPQGTCPTHKTEAGWEIGSISTESFTSNNPYPANGVIFVEDNLWLDGKINNNRLTIAAGSFYDNGNGDPQAKNITINHRLEYTNYDGRDALGIIAQNNLSIGLVSDNDMRIDGALISKGGRIGRAYYAPPTRLSNKCALNGIRYDTRDSLYIYGMMAAVGSGGFSWSDGTGYQSRTIVYDSNLYYNPPPSFPFTSSQYNNLKWREVQQ